MERTLLVSAVFVVMLAIGRCQQQYFYPFGASLSDRQQQQQQLYQSLNPASYNYLQVSPQEAAPHEPASNVNQNSFTVSQPPVQSTSVSVLPYQQLTSSATDSAAQTTHAAFGTSRTAPAAGLLGVAFSPAADVSQFRFSGSFANYSY